MTCCYHVADSSVAGILIKRHIQNKTKLSESELALCVKALFKNKIDILLSSSEFTKKFSCIKREKRDYIPNIPNKLLLNSSLHSWDC